MVWIVGGIVALFILSGKINLSLNGVGGTFFNNNAVPTAGDNIPAETTQNQRNAPQSPAAPWAVGNTGMAPSNQITQTMLNAVSVMPVRIPVSVYPVRRTMQY